MNGKAMARIMKTFIISGVLLAALGRASSLLAQSPEWGSALEKQMRSAEACKVLYLVNVREYRLFNHDIVEARVQCEDGRSFDVVRKERQLPFEINPCKPIEC